MFQIRSQSQGDKRLYPQQAIVEKGKIIHPEVWVYAQADTSSARITQYTYGEPLGVMRKDNGMLYVQSLRDDYCGWISGSAYQSQDIGSPSHLTRFNTPITTDANLKSSYVCTLPRDSILIADDEHGDYWHFPHLGWAHRRHLSNYAERQAILTTAEQLLGQSYVWGGRGVAGLDCSALAQLCYRWAGKDIPRDADLQACYLKAHHKSVTEDEWQVADLVFVPGHVMIISGDNEVIHASGHDMRVVREPLSQALTRYKESLKSRYQLQAYRWQAEL